MNPVTYDRGRYRKFGKQYKEGFHVGHDFDVDIDTPVYAVDDGIIIFADMVDGFGSLNPNSKGGVIIIEHDGFCTLYGHIKINVSFIAGDKVFKGQEIGKVAEFYNARFLLPHLHFCKYIGSGMPKTKWGYVQKKSDLGLWLNPLSS